MKVKKVPMRRCVGCMESKPKKELIRIYADQEKGLAIDPTGKANGRGVYLCLKEECFKLARKKNGIGRGLEASFNGEQLDKLFEELKVYENKNS